MSDQQYKNMSDDRPRKFSNSDEKCLSEIKTNDNIETSTDTLVNPETKLNSEPNSSENMVCNDEAVNSKNGPGAGLKHNDAVDLDDVCAKNEMNPVKFRDNVEVSTLGVGEQLDPVSIMQSYPPENIEEPDEAAIFEAAMNYQQNRRLQFENLIREFLTESTDKILVSPLWLSMLECRTSPSSNMVWEDPLYPNSCDERSEIAVNSVNRENLISCQETKEKEEKVSKNNEGVEQNIEKGIHKVTLPNISDVVEEPKISVAIEGREGDEVNKEESSKTNNGDEAAEVEVVQKSKNMKKKEWRRKQKKLQRLEKKDADFSIGFKREKRKAEDDFSDSQDIKKLSAAYAGAACAPNAKLETKALKAKRPGFSEERYNETSYFMENGLRKVYPYYFTFTTFTKGRWVGEKILDVFAKEFRAHPAEEYERCIKSGTLTVNYERVDTDYRLKHNDLLANIVHRHEVPVTAARIPLIYADEDTVVVDKPASIPVHPCGRYRHNTVVFILAKEYNLKNLRTIHRLDRLTSGLLLFGRTPKKAREMEQQIRTRQVTKQYVCRVEGRFSSEHIECSEPIEVVSYKIGVCKVSPAGKDCKTKFQLLSYNGTSSVVLCRPYTGRMHQIRVHLQYLGFPIVNDPLYNHTVFGANKGKGGITDKTDDQLIQDLIKIHNAENWLGMDGDAEYSMFKSRDKDGTEEEGGSQRNTPSPKDKAGSGSPRVVSSPALPPGATLTTTPSIIPYPPEMLPPPPAVHRNVSPATGDAGSTRKSSSGAGSPAEPSSGVERAEYTFRPQMMTVDSNCYECKVRYRDPKPRDLVMFLHALTYSGPGWQFETKMPDWAAPDWTDSDAER